MNNSLAKVHPELVSEQNAQLIVIFLQLAAGVLTVEYHRCRAPLLDFIFDLNRT